MASDERRMSAESAMNQRSQRTPWAVAPIALGIAAGLVLCAIIYATVNLTGRASTPDPKPIAIAICADLTTQQYDHLYTLLTPSLQQQGSQAQFVASQRELDKLLGAVRSCHATVSANTGSSATLTLTLARQQSTQSNVELTTAQDAWHIESYDQTV